MMHHQIRRPLIVSIIAVLFFLAVPAFGLSIYDALQVLAGNVPGVSATSAYLQLAVALVLIPVCVIVGVGLWRLREWGRNLAIVALVAVIVNIVLNSLQLPSLLVALLNALSGSLVPGALILLLLHPMTRAAFQAAQGARR